MLPPPFPAHTAGVDEDQAAAPEMRAREEKPPPPSQPGFALVSSQVAAEGRMGGGGRGEAARDPPCGVAMLVLRQVLGFLTSSCTCGMCVWPEN
jgi:hypothetical protein